MQLFTFKLLKQKVKYRAMLALNMVPIGKVYGKHQRHGIRGRNSDQSVSDPGLRIRHSEARVRAVQRRTVH